MSKDSHIVKVWVDGSKTPVVFDGEQVDVVYERGFVEFGVCTGNTWRYVAYPSSSIRRIEQIKSWA